MDGFSGAVAVVTGGASGLGRGLCEALAKRGAKLLIADIQLENAEALAATLRSAGADVTAVRVDVTDARSVDALIERTVELHGRIDYMFNNAGIVAAGAFEDVAADTFRKVIEINLLGSAYGTIAAYRRMITQRSGQIVNIASMYALMPNPFSASYVAAKHGLGGLTQSVMTEAAQHGVTLTLICPGYIATQLFASGTYAGSSSQSEVLERIPFKLLDVQTAVDLTLRAVLAKKKIAVFPAYVRAMWWIHRVSPGFLIWLMQRVVAYQSKRFAAPQP